MSSTSPQVTSAPLHIPGLELQEKIGEGGMSVVYRAVHCNLQRTLAVKILHGAADDVDAGPSWLRESRLMASLTHPHVVAVHDAGHVDGHHYLLMEYMAGGSLRTRMRPGEPWPLSKAASLLDHIAQALRHIHGQRVLHLDLKPENILFSAEGQIKISDFGLSTPHTDANSLLVGRHFQGTLDYCAPEYRCGLALDERYDVFSLATLAYELFTGRLPGRIYVPASERNPLLPKSLDSVLRRGLARDPNERYASVAEFQAALAEACAPEPARVSHRLLELMAGLAAIVLILLPLYLRGRPPGLPALFPSHSPEMRPWEQPDRLVAFYDNPEDLSLFEGETIGKMLESPGVALEKIQVEQPMRKLPHGLPLPIWPMPRPVLLIHSPGAWGFVHPIQDRALAQKVVQRWPELLQQVITPENNLVRAGSFDGNSLSLTHEGDRWRAGNTAGWSELRQITLDRPKPTDNPALLLTNMDSAKSTTLLGCYQPVRWRPPPSSTVVLRYRARSQRGKGNLAVYFSMPVVVPPDDKSPAASQIRKVATAIAPTSSDPAPNQWLYRSPGWVIPTDQWQTFVVVSECPPYPTEALHRNLVIDLGATSETSVDQVWVDDVELFVWQPGNKP